jgi:hypothetical protein
MPRHLGEGACAMGTVVIRFVNPNLKETCSNRPRAVLVP